MAKRPAPEVVTLSPTQLEELLAKLAGLLPAEIYQLVAPSYHEKPMWCETVPHKGVQPVAQKD